MNQAEFNVLSDRLDSLEFENRRLRRESRWLRRGAALSILGIVVALSTGAGRGRDVPKVIEAEKFILLDETGEKRSVWGTAPGGAGTIAFFQENILRISLSMLPSGEAILDVRDKDGTGRLRLGVVPDRGPVLSLMDQDGESSRIGMAVQKDGTASLGLGRVGKGPNDKDPLALVVGKDGSAGFNLTGPENKERLSLFLKPNGKTGLALYSKEGKGLLGFTLREDGYAGGTLANPSGSGVIEFVLSPTVHPFFRFAIQRAKLSAKCHKFWEGP